MNDFQVQLKGKDEEYVKALKQQAEDIEELLERMRMEFRELQVIWRPLGEGAGKGDSSTVDKKKIIGPRDLLCHCTGLKISPSVRIQQYATIADGFRGIQTIPDKFCRQYIPNAHDLCQRFPKVTNGYRRFRRRPTLSCLQTVNEVNHCSPTSSHDWMPTDFALFHQPCVM